MRVYESTYKGNPILVIEEKPDDRYPVKIGLRKCRLILRNLKAVIAFVKAHDDDKKD